MAAFLNATSSVIQRFEAGEASPKELFRGDFMKNLSRNPKWLWASLLELLAFVFQAIALRKGSLLIVQPLMTFDLVFLMLILHFHKHVTVGKREWLAIAMICVGLSGMLISAEPTASQKPYVSSRLLLTSLIVAVIICIGIYVVRRTAKNSYRAAVSGVAAGFSFALLAAFTKIVTRELSHGILSTFSTWQFWAFAVTGIVAVIMTQNTYGSGPVAVSQPTMEIVESIVSISLGIYLFSDSINLGAVNIFFAFLTAIIAGLGIVLLSRSKRLQIAGS
jgi:hypothetical protein